MNMTLNMKMTVTMMMLQKRVNGRDAGLDLKTVVARNSAETLDLTNRHQTVSCLNEDVQILII